MFKLLIICLCSVFITEISGDGNGGRNQAATDGKAGISNAFLDCLMDSIFEAKLTFEDMMKNKSFVTETVKAFNDLDSMNAKDRLEIAPVIDECRFILEEAKKENPTCGVQSPCENCRARLACFRKVMGPNKLTASNVISI